MFIDYNTVNLISLVHEIYLLAIQATFKINKINKKKFINKHSTLRNLEEKVNLPENPKLNNLQT